MGLLGALGDIFGATDGADDATGDDATDDDADAGAPEGDPGADGPAGATSPGEAGAAIANVVGDGPAEFAAEAEDFEHFYDDLDYATDSLSRLDEIAASRGDRADHLHAELDSGEQVHFSPTASGMACYVGEVLVRTYDDAAWTSEGDLGWVVTVDGPGGTATVDVFGLAHESLAGEPAFSETHDDVLAETAAEWEFVDDGGEESVW